MNILSIDIGTYSIKFIESAFDKKKLIHHHIDSVVIDQYRQQFPKEITLEEIQYEIIKEYLKHRKFDGKIIYQLPAYLLTGRLLNLPVKNRRKAEQLIPFQLDKDLLYPINNVHYDSQLILQKESIHALVSVIETNKFDQIHKSLETNHILPSILTAESSVYQSYVQTKRKDGSFCILDIGHESTKSHFFYNRTLIANHLSHIAGKNIEEAISETYLLSIAEARKYKETKAFVLTSEQLEKADDKQREFAKLMDKVLTPLIAEVKRWELGHRIKVGKKIEQIYITGGSSNIKNLCFYLSKALSTKVLPMETIYPENLHKIELSNERINILTLAHLMGLSVTSKFAPVNFLCKKYANVVNQDIPLYSASFIGVRVVIITLIVCFSLFIGSQFDYKNEQNFDRRISSIIKRPEINLKRDTNMARRRPAGFLPKIKEKLNKTQLEISELKKANALNSFNSFVKVATILKDISDIELNSIEENDQLVVGKLLVKTEQAEKAAIAKLKELKIQSMKISTDKENKMLNFEYTEK